MSMTTILYSCSCIYWSTVCMDNSKHSSSAYWIGNLLHIALHLHQNTKAKFLSNRDERAPLVACQAIRVQLGHFASCWYSCTARVSATVHTPIPPRSWVQRAAARNGKNLVQLYSIQQVQHTAVQHTAVQHTAYSSWYAPTAWWSDLFFFRLYWKFTELPLSLVTINIVASREFLSPSATLSTVLLLLSKHPA